MTRKMPFLLENLLMYSLTMSSAVDQNSLFWIFSVVLLFETVLILVRHMNNVDKIDICVAN